MSYRVKPKFISKKWGWGVQFSDSQDVVYEDNVMITFETEEETVEWIKNSKFVLDTENI